MNIGLISDTHGYLDPRIISYFENCDEVWHAGDVGPISVLDALAQAKPLYGVYGNIDGQQVRAHFPKDQWLEREGLKIFMTHIAGKPGAYNKRVKDILNSTTPDVLICGHSHILRVQKDPSFKDMLYINPGAAGKHGLAILNVENPQAAFVDQMYNANGCINDAHDVQLGITNVSQFAYVADGKNGLRVIQLTSPEVPGNDGFSPRPIPFLVASYKLPKHGHALAISRGMA